MGHGHDDAAVAALRARLLLTLEFIEGVQDFPSGAQMRRIVEDAAGRGNERALRLLVKEVDSLKAALAPHHQEGLSALLQSRLGVDTERERAERQRHVAAALRRGAVRSEKERRRLEEYADMLETAGGDPKEIADVRRLLRAG